jgi:lysine biosynthesis protein LysW
METAPCPECTYEITLPNPREGQRLACPNCGAELEVISSRPLELDWTYTEPEDDLSTLDLEDDEWDEDWEDDELDEAEEEDEDWEEL